MIMMDVMQLRFYNHVKNTIAVILDFALFHFSQLIIITEHPVLLQMHCTITLLHYYINQVIYKNKIELPFEITLEKSY